MGEPRMTPRATAHAQRQERQQIESPAPASTPERPQIRRRDLLARGAFASASGAALAVVGPGAIGTAAADNPNETVVQIDRANPRLSIQDAIDSGSGTYRFCGDGTGAPYELASEVRIWSRNNVHLIFEPDVTISPASEFAYGFNVIGTTNFSMTGGVFDAANKLVLRRGTDLPQGSAFVLVQQSTGLVFQDMTFLNTGGKDGILVDGVLVDGELSTVGVAPPDAIRVTGSGASANVLIQRCVFSYYRACVDALSTVNLTIVDNQFSDLLDSTPDSLWEPFNPAAGNRIDGGAFISLRGTCQTVNILRNRTTPGRFCFESAEVGGSVVLHSAAALRLAPGQIRAESDPGHTNVTVSDNVFVGNPGAWVENVRNGANGDVLTIKNVKGFTVERNVIDGAGEFGIVVSHGSTNGVVRDNIVRSSDGSAIAIGAANAIEPAAPDDPDQSPKQTNPRVMNINVIGNTLRSSGIDAAGDLGRFRGAPSNTLLFNYASAVCALRIWNAQNVLLDDNVITHYRSSGIWVKHAFANANDRDNNIVLDLSVRSTNVIEPFRSDNPAMTFDAPLSGAGPHPDLEPWTGESRLYTINSSGVQSATNERVSGFEPSRYVGPVEYTPIIHWQAPPEPAIADILTPESGTVLPCDSAEFTWSAGPSDEFWIYAGSNRGANDYYDSNSLGDGTSVTVTGLPGASLTVHIRLWHRLGQAAWEYVDHTYTACPVIDTGVVELQSPTPGSTLACGLSTFQWSRGTSDQFWIYSGPSRGSSDYYDSGNLGDVAAVSLAIFPDDGSIVWMRLWYRSGNAVWKYIDASYTAC